MLNNSPTSFPPGFKSSFILSIYLVLKLGSIAQKNVRERLAETLLELHSLFSFGGCGDNGINPITLKREDIANIVGTATETVVRLLHTFKDEGIIAGVEFAKRVFDYVDSSMKLDILIEDGAKVIS